MDVTNSFTSKDFIYTNKDPPDTNAKGAVQQQEQQNIFFLFQLRTEHRYAPYICCWFCITLVSCSERLWFLSVSESPVASQHSAVLPAF